jgi:hypothetical protein
MKTLTLAILSAAIILSSCSSTKKTTTSNGDDVYYNPGQEVEQAVTPVSVPVVARWKTYLPSRLLSDYERYRLQQEAQMLGETYEPEGSEALYVEQYQLTDSMDQGAVIGQETAPVIVNNYNYYTDPNDYYYSSNLRRFSDEYYGWDYYDPYY